MIDTRNDQGLWGDGAKFRRARFIYACYAYATYQRPGHPPISVQGLFPCD